MQRRGASGKSVKGQSANRPKARKAPTAHLSTDHSPEQFDLIKRERDEGLEQLAATSEVLRVISSTPGDLEPVFQSMLANAVRICEAKFGTMLRAEEGGYRVVAMHGPPPAYAAERRRNPVLRVGPMNPLARVAASKQLQHIADIRTERAYLDRDPAFVGLADDAGARTLLMVPMLKENKLIGAIAIYRQEVRPFTDKQIELVKNFGAQAVIAIENTRLLSELRESLQQQTATADVLRVISSSPGELQPVFETIASRSVALCGATFGIVFRSDGEMISIVAHHNLDQPALEALNRMYPMRADREGTLMGQVIMERSILHIRDVAAEPRYTVAATLQETLGTRSFLRSFLGVPMLQDGNPIGGIALYRRKVELFSDRQIELVKAFAAQTVIAVENARLLTDLNKLNQQLEQRVTDQVSEIERMGRLRRFLPPQVADLIVASGAEKQLESHRREITALFCDCAALLDFLKAPIQKT